MNVISIGGASRSGSTLLAVLLGRLDGFFPVGELRYIWSRGFVQNQLCGCGKPFHGCLFWQSVLEEAYGSVANVPVEEINDLHLAIAQMKRLPELLISPIRTPRLTSRVNGYVRHLERLCRAVLSVSGAHTLVDSSKQPAFCYVLSRLPCARVELVHLVRDSRAVAFSYMRKKRKPDIHWTEAYMTSFPPRRTAFDWTFLNLGMELIRAAGVPCSFMRYEDLVEDPARQLQRILPSVRGLEEQLAHHEEMSIPTNHTVSGNPLRFTQGSLRLRPDTEWERRMKRKDRVLMTALTWPLLRRYRYLNAGLRAKAPPSLSLEQADQEAEASALRYQDSSSSAV